MIVDFKMSGGETDGYADGQHSPEDIPRPINALRERNVDIVIRSRIP